MFDPPPFFCNRPSKARAVGPGLKGVSSGEACRPELALRPLFSGSPPQEKAGRTRTREKGTYPIKVGSWAELRQGQKARPAGLLESRGRRAEGQEGPEVPL